ncbi:MAG: GNAT family N-acetyltransferase [Sphingobacteriia bacterium]|nr:GNAT family N-acetyltransferase [Sphingobacteriia bacterium]
MNNFIVRDNLLDLWEELSKLDNKWKVKNQGDIIALRANVKMPISFCFGVKTEQELKEIESFFEDYKFWVVTENNISEWEIIREKYILDSKDSVMYLDTNKYISINYENIDIRPLTKEWLNDWVEIGAKVFNLDRQMTYDFISPSLDIPRQQLFMAFDKDKPVGTSLVYIDKLGNAVLQFIAVLEEHRNKRIGNALTRVCIDHAIKHGIKNIALYSSHDGEKMYTKIGFKTIQKHYMYTNM